MSIARANLSNTFNGKIVDESNKPLANATIQIPNLNIATTTNNKGNFSFKAPDSTLKVLVVSAGFETQNMELTTDRIDEENINNIIRLKPSLLTLSEVTTSNNGKQKKADLTKAKNITIQILDAEPVAGWNDYNQYLEKNKHIPDELKNIHGSIIVLFIVDNNGTLKNIRIKKSLNQQLDAEAIRLVTEGPSWKLLTGTKAKVSVTVKF
jgi:TonB family protein